MAKKKENGAENLDILKGRTEENVGTAEDMTDNNSIEKFQEKLKELLAMAKKKKNMLEYQEISDFFSDMNLDAERFDRILEFLETNNIDVLRITDDDVDDEMLLEVEEEEEIEV